MPEVTIGDILKSEADFNSRIAIPATASTKAGQPVIYELRNEYLIALTDEVNGKVLVQPHNCVIHIDAIDAEALADITIEVLDDEADDGSMTTAELTVDMLIAQGDAHGIKYVDTRTA